MIYAEQTKLDEDVIGSKFKNGQGAKEPCFPLEQASRKTSACALLVKYQ